MDKVLYHHRLLEWFRKNQRSMPWRETRNPYKIWVSEIMLQQTQVKTVIPYYLKFLHRFPTVESLAEADLNAVLKYWEGLGYYSRGRNLHKAAKQVVEKYQGRIPKDEAEIRTLPGIGEYTAAAILSIAHDIPLPAVDGNVRRVLSRMLKLSVPVNASSSYGVFSKEADALMCSGEPGQYNQAMMELGATVCKPSRPLCADCPVNGFCGAFLEGTVESFPVRRRSKEVPTHRIAVGVVIRDGSFLITRRKQSGLLGGLWEFPGGKIQKNETAEQACIRELNEETSLNVTVVSHLQQVKHAYSHFKIVMDVFVCRYVSGEVSLSGPVDFKWITPAEIGNYPFPGANHKFIPNLREFLKSRLKSR